MLTEICAEIKNYFSKEEDRYIGDFAISDSVISPAVPIVEGQYYRIVGSIFNDGVHSYDDVLTDEGVFHGAVWLMRVPQGVIDLANDIDDWLNRYGSIDSQNMSPFQSEGFGGYSYSKGSRYSGTSNGGTFVSWQDMFASRLNQYRRIRVL